MTDSALSTVNKLKVSSPAGKCHGGEDVTETDSKQIDQLRKDMKSLDQEIAELEANLRAAANNL